MSDNGGRRAERERLLNQVIDLQTEVQSGGDAEARALLSHARAALMRHDAENIARRHNREIDRSRRVRDRSSGV
jgi:hypothetical protein